MIVAFDNLGPVHHAEIDLGKRLIVFAGPNHSGKTHVAWTIYGLLQRARLGSLEFGALELDMVAEVLAAGDVGVASTRFAEFGREYLRHGVAGFAAELAMFFVTDRDLFRETQIQLTVDDSDLTPLLQGTLIRVVATPADVAFAAIEDIEEPILRVDVVTSPPHRTDLAPSSSSEAKGAQADGPSTERIAAEVASILTTLIGYRVRELRPIIFPTERTAVSLFSRELFSSRFGLVDEILKSSANPAEIIRLARRSARRYPGPIGDCIKVANDLVDLARQKSDFADLALELEGILGGRVDVSAEGEIGFTLAEPGRPRVPFHVSASVVKSLASLVFYFRHQAQDGATLVIDEPELNLHPDLQRKVTRFLAKAVNRGFRIILSTHSDYVLREFSNLVRLGAAGERGAEVATALGYDPECTLKPDLVGVWHFANGGAESLKINGDGFNLSSIEDVIGQQNMDSERIEFAVGK